MKCRTCGECKKLDDFYTNSRSKPLLDCKPCHNRRSSDRQKQWRKDNPELAREFDKRRRAKKTPEQIRRHRIRSEYGVGVEYIDELRLAQGGLCAICGADSKLVIDHCHKSGRVRGLLCTGCNVGLGFFKDSISNLESAITYLASDSEVG